MTDKQAEIIAKAIRDGFADLAGRIAGSTPELPMVGGHENLSLPLEELARNIDGIAAGLHAVASAIEGQPDS